MKQILKNYGLSIVLAILFLGSWVVQTWAGWVKFSGEQIEQGSVPEWFGSHGYIYEWLAATFENWQSEFLQLLAFVVLTSFLIHKGSHESKDTDEEMMTKLDAIESKLDKLQKT